MTGSSQQFVAKQLGKKPQAWIMDNSHAGAAACKTPQRNKVLTVCKLDAE